MVVLAVSGWLVINLVLIAILLWMVGNWAYYKIRGRQLKGAIHTKEFEQGMRKAQLLDLRDKKDFDAGHILGARNMPSVQVKTWAADLRKDLPVYMYETGENIAIRVALRLKKAGFTNVKWLKGGYADWDGKVKKTVNKYND
ncbi:rhodanese-like domain-containing protein [Lapidilactobacillus bayanensis]|uniref:rhodanese-like domain-containing protein n=1 Tax=Lapidilactobacillus bayanensis TaxID=2485998 RepID=UPI000F781D88|nr:rhodanese-like domain-containing protein [Lapidilactobacillus bayanensis]